MLISYSHQFFFHHMPKTGGVSVAERLEPYCAQPERVWINRLLEQVGIRVNLVLGPHHWKRFRCHTDMHTVQRVLPRDVFDSLYKFTFVRNPWDWLVSRYHYIQQRNRHGQHRRVGRLGGFAEYVRWQASKRRHGQSELVMDRSGNLLVDFVGRYETLAEDFATVTQHLRMPIKPLGRRNTSNHEDYRTYYDRATQQFVRDHWAHDIEAFGYEYEEVAPPQLKVA
ncbi:MAG: sulfotransferase family 2 domain-containing protein [Planctomycetota bacterium]